MAWLLIIIFFVLVFASGKKTTTTTTGSSSDPVVNSQTQSGDSLSQTWNPQTWQNTPIVQAALSDQEYYPQKYGPGGQFSAVMQNGVLRQDWLNNVMQLNGTFNTTYQKTATVHYDSGRLSAYITYN